MSVLPQTVNDMIQEMDPSERDQVSDGWHSFADLYRHRLALTAAIASAAATMGDSWRSKLHHPDDRPISPLNFIVGIQFPTGLITYHYRLAHWDDFASVPEIPHAPAWDGVGPDETVDILLRAARCER